MIRYLAMLFMEPGDEIIVQRQSFDAAPWWATAMGGVVRYVDARTTPTTSPPTPPTVGPHTNLVWITSPDNPSGTIVRRAEVEGPALARPGTGRARVRSGVPRVRHRQRSTRTGSPLFVGPRNVIVLRTFSKAYGLAGLRLGYVLADGAVCGALAGSTNRFTSAVPPRSPASPPSTTSPGCTRWSRGRSPSGAV